MIYVLDTHRQFAKWVSGYVSNLVKGMRELGAEVEVIEGFAHTPTEKDVVIVVDYGDLDDIIAWREKEKLKFKIVSHSHGTSAFTLGCKARGDIDREKNQLQKVDLVCCNTEHHKRALDNADYGNSVVTGYPIDFGFIRSFALPKDTERKGIVVGGRIEQDRQLFLAVEALEPYGKDVIFCTPNTKDWAYVLWGEDTIDRFEKMFTFHWECSQQEFYRILAKAEVVTSFGCVDTLNLSIIEGAVLGCYPLAPNKEPYLEYLSEGYEPYSISDIRKRIANKPPVCMSYLVHDYRLVAKRYLDAIDKLIGGK